MWPISRRGSTPALAEAGRASDDLDRYLVVDGLRAHALTSGEFSDSVVRAGELGFTDVLFHWPRPGRTVRR